VPAVGIIVASILPNGRSKHVVPFYLLLGSWQLAAAFVSCWQLSFLSTIAGWVWPKFFPATETTAKISKVNHFLSFYCSNLLTTVANNNNKSFQRSLLTFFIPCLPCTCTETMIKFLGRVGNGRDGPNDNEYKGADKHFV